MAKVKPTTEVKNTILWRIYMVMLAMLLLSVIILLRVLYTQYILGEELREKAQKRYIDNRPVEATRGNILAADGSLFATSLPYFELRFDAQAPHPDTFALYVDTLATCLSIYVDQSMTPGAWRQKLIEARKSNEKYLLIRRDVSYLDLQQIKSFPIFKYGRHKGGFIYNKTSKRQYPFKMLAHRTVGYIRTREAKDSLGEPVVDTLMVGLEDAFNDILAGENAMRPMQRIAKDVWVPLSDISDIEPKAGMDLVTTLDVNIQDVAQKALLKGLQTYQADYGCAIVMDVATGEIRAMVNIGATNPERTQYWESYNWAIADRVEPGSTFKLASILALLEDGYISPDDTVNLNLGKARFFDEVMEDASYHGLTITTMAKAFELSSNVGIARLANQHYNQDQEGRERFVKHLHNFGFQYPLLNEQLRGEQDPYIKNPSSPDWSGITVPWMSIGYEVGISPLQLLSFFNGVANNGRLMRPLLVKEIRAYGELKERFEPEILRRRMASQESIDMAKELLLRVTEGPRGTARDIKTPQYRIAGKTGTAIINYAAAKRGREAKRYRASFAGFFPVENPMYSCIVMVTNPRNGLYGGVVAAPIFREIADYCYTYATKSHPPMNRDLEQIVYTADKLPDLQVGKKDELLKLYQHFSMPVQDRSQTDWTIATVQADTVRLISRNIPNDVMPNVIGMGLRDALYLIENLEVNLKVKVVGVGKVRSQSVKPGRGLRGLSTITLVLG